MNVEQMRQKLQPMNLREVSRITGIHPNVLYRLASGKNPSMRTFEKLRAWLEGVA